MTMLSFLTFCLISFVFVLHIDCNSDVEFLEKEFIGHIDRDKRKQDTVISAWDTEQHKILCERATNNSRQFSFSQSPFLTKNTLIFNYCLHEPVQLDLLKCPAENTFIYESRRQQDCYLIMNQKIFQNVGPVGYLYIQSERCGLGLDADGQIVPLK